MMRILVLGGTNFIGPHVVAALLEGGHEVTVFNRGKTPDTLPESVERLRGDRAAGEVDALRGRTFDATVDMCGYFPRAVSAVFDALEDPGYVCFISSVSVYASFAELGQDETAPVLELDDPTVEEIGMETYGGLKVLCEREVASRAARHACLRLGLVVGPGDATDRFSYWPVRTEAGGVMIAPGRPSDPLQWIDARDVADFARTCVEENITGTFNLTTPPGRHTIGALIEESRRLADSSARQMWLAPSVLQEEGLEPWSDLPAWLPPNGDSAGFARFDSSKAVAAGLRFRPRKVTVKDVLDWWREQSTERRQLRAGIDGEREMEIVRTRRENTPIVALADAVRDGAVGSLLRAAFGRDDENLLVEKLRNDDVEAFEGEVSCGDKMVGHILFSRLKSSPDGLSAWALAPMAVHPDWQRQGVGSLLADAGIEACRSRGADLVCVLGHSDYYPRFGFSAQLGEKVSSAYSSAGSSWMALELTPGAADEIDSVEFAAPFNEGSDER